MALLTLAEAKAALNITTTNYDTELTDYIAGAEAAVTFICGPVDSTAATDVVEVCGGSEIPLNCTPVLSVTSVTGDWTGVRAVTDFHVNLATGVLKLKASAFRLLPDTYTVVYATGRASTPSAMKQAAKIILKHQWSTQRGPSGRRAADADSSPGATNRTIVPGLGYALPNAALQMLAPYDRGPAIG